MYQFFEHAYITELLRSFVSDASCSSSPSAFGKVVGGRLDMNASVMRVGGKLIDSEPERPEIVCEPVERGHIRRELHLELSRYLFIGYHQN